MAGDSEEEDSDDSADTQDSFLLQSGMDKNLYLDDY